MKDGSYVKYACYVSFTSPISYFALKHIKHRYGFLLDAYMTLLSPSVSRISRYFRHPCSCTDIAALLRQLDGRVKREDLVHVSFENDGKKKPWFVAIDRARRSVVLSVRGSLSAVDVVTDLCFADPTQNKVASESLELYQRSSISQKRSQGTVLCTTVFCVAL